MQVSYTNGATYFRDGMTDDELGDELQRIDPAEVEGLEVWREKQMFGPHAHNRAGRKRWEAERRDAAKRGPKYTPPKKRKKG